MKTISGVVVKKTDVYRKYARHGGSWLTFTVTLADDTGRRTVFMSPVFHQQLNVGDEVELTGKTVGRAFAVNENGGKVIVTGHRDVEEIVEEPEEVPAEAEEMTLDIDYVSRPVFKHSMHKVSSKMSDGTWVNVPTRVASSYFGDEWSGFWPNNGFGTLTCKATQEQYGITVHEILEWEPNTRTISHSIPLSEVRFGDGYVMVHGVRIPDSELPFSSRQIMNDVRSSFTGDLVATLTKAEIMTGFWDRNAKRVQSQWVRSPESETTILIDDDILEKFGSLVVTYEDQKRINDGIRALKEIIKQQKALTEEELAAQTGLTRDEVRRAMTSETYDMAFFEFLMKLGPIEHGIYPVEDGFMILYKNASFDALVYERPEMGKATYIYDLPDFPGGPQEIYTLHQNFNLLDLRKGLNEDDKLDVAGKVGLRGVAIHTTMEGWVPKLMTSLAQCKARPDKLIEGPLGMLALMLGIDPTGGTKQGKDE